MEGKMPYDENQKNDNLKTLKRMLLLYNFFFQENRQWIALSEDIYVVRSSTRPLRRINGMWNEIKLERKAIHRKDRRKHVRRNLSFADITRYFDRDEARDKWRSALQFHHLFYIYIYIFSISFESVRNLSGAFIHDIADRKD